MSKITPFLWFNNNAEEAMNFYLSVFKNSREISVNRLAADAGPYPKGMVMTVVFEINGTQFVGLNGGPQFQFTPAVSFFVKCADQAEIDYYWDALIAGDGKPVECGWLVDKYGLSWQIVPENVHEIVGKPKVMEAMMKMQKLDIAELKAAGL